MNWMYTGQIKTKKILIFWKISKPFIITWQKLKTINSYANHYSNMKPYLEADEVEDHKAPVRACYRYLSNRTNQLDYKTAIEQELPIGSG